MRHGCGKTKIDSFVVIPQRFVVCNGCGSTYTGPKHEVECPGCGVSMETKDVRCVKKMPTGTWMVANERLKSRPSENEGS